MENPLADDKGPNQKSEFTFHLLHTPFQQAHLEFQLEAALSNANLERMSLQDVARSEAERIEVSCVFFYSINILSFTAVNARIASQFSPIHRISVAKVAVLDALCFTTLLAPTKNVRTASQL